MPLSRSVNENSIVRGLVLTVHFQISYCKLVPVILLVHTTYEDGTVCSETSAHKIQKPGNHPKEGIWQGRFCEGVQECMWRFARHDTLSLISFTGSQSHKRKTCTRQRADWSLRLVFLSCNWSFILGGLLATMTRFFYLLETGHKDSNNLAAQIRGCAWYWEAIQAVLIDHQFWFQLMHHNFTLLSKSPSQTYQPYSRHKRWRWTSCGVCIVCPPEDGHVGARNM
jgi:hypothetical protein